MAWMNDMADMLGSQSTPAASLKLATMTAPNACTVGTLQLAAEDLMFADHLLQPKCTKVSETAPDGGGACSDKSAYLPALQAGDIVLVYQLSDSKFLVLERMVNSV